MFSCTVSDSVHPPVAIEERETIPPGPDSRAAMVEVGAVMRGELRELSPETIAFLWPKLGRK